MRVAYADVGLREQIGRDLGEVALRHTHVDDGFTLVAFDAGRVVGVLAVEWRQLPASLEGVCEAFIDIIEVAQGYRRRGIASVLIAEAESRAREAGAAQLRAWSSEGRDPAICMWRARGFALCPAVVHPHGEEVRGFFAAKVL